MCIMCIYIYIFKIYVLVHDIALIYYENKKCICKIDRYVDR